MAIVDEHDKKFLIFYVFEMSSCASM
jgi:hypothetical protein